MGGGGEHIKELRVENAGSGGDQLLQIALESVWTAGDIEHEFRRILQNGLHQLGIEPGAGGINEKKTDLFLLPVKLVRWESKKQASPGEVKLLSGAFGAINGRGGDFSTAGGQIRDFHCAAEREHPTAAVKFSQIPDTERRDKSNNGIDQTGGNLRIGLKEGTGGNGEFSVSGEGVSDDLRPVVRSQVNNFINGCVTQFERISKVRIPLRKNAVDFRVDKQALTDGDKCCIIRSAITADAIFNRHADFVAPVETLRSGNWRQDHIFRNAAACQKTLEGGLLPKNFTRIRNVSVGTAGTLSGMGTERFDPVGRGTVDSDKFRTDKTGVFGNNFNRYIFTGNSTADKTAFAGGEYTIGFAAESKIADIYIKLSHFTEVC